MSLERLFDQIGHDLGWNDHNMRRDRPYNGQPHTDTGTRGATEVKGITFRDLRDCMIRAFFISTGGGLSHQDQPEVAKRLSVLYEEALKGENAVLCENDLYGWNLDKLDPVSIIQNLACEVERIMGIYPNVPKLTYTSDPETPDADHPTP